MIDISVPRHIVKFTIGDLREKITIQTVTAARDSLGGITETVATYKEVWAKVEALRGREYFDARQLHSERMLRFIVRYDSGITHQKRISYDSRSFEIEEVYDPDNRSHWMIILAVEQA
jgi:SPP1 family predicted phage head-tail adaptor